MGALPVAWVFLVVSFTDLWAAMLLRSTSRDGTYRKRLLATPYNLGRRIGMTAAATAQIPSLSEGVSSVEAWTLRGRRVHRRLTPPALHSTFSPQFLYARCAVAPEQ